MLSYLSHCIGISKQIGEKIKKSSRRVIPPQPPSSSVPVPAHPPHYKRNLVNETHVHVAPAKTDRPGPLPTTPHMATCRTYRVENAPDFSTSSPK